MRRLLVLLILSLTAAAPAAVAAPSDPLFEDQYGLRIVGAPTAWESSRGAGATVAVVDTGADLDHPDLADNLVGGRNFVEDGQPPQDDHGHGTHVGGIVGALTGNGRGVASMAPEVNVMPVRTLRKDEADGQAKGSCSDVRAGIRWAADQGADVINLSLGGITLVDAVLGSCIEGAVEDAWAAGAIPVIAAGNDFLPISAYDDLNAIVVAATNRNDEHAGYSNGTAPAKWGMAAPGSEIVSTWLDGYARASGTSMAAPHVAGAAALLRSLGVSQQRTVDVLLATAEDLGPPGEDSTYGHGRLDAAAAVAAVTGGSGGGSSGTAGGATGANEPTPEPVREPTGGGSSDGDEDPDGPGGPSRSPDDRGSGQDGSPTPSSAASPEGAGGSDAGAGSEGAPSPLAGAPTSDEGGASLPIAGMIGVLGLSAGALFWWLRRGGP